MTTQKDLEDLSDGDCSHGVHGPWCREWRRMEETLKALTEATQLFVTALDKFEATEDMHDDIEKAGYAVDHYRGLLDTALANAKDKSRKVRTVSVAPNLVKDAERALRTTGPEPVSEREVRVRDALTRLLEHIVPSDYTLDLDTHDDDGKPRDPIASPPSSLVPSERSYTVVPEFNEAGEPTYPEEK